MSAPESDVIYAAYQAIAWLYLLLGVMAGWFLSYVVRWAIQRLEDAIFFRDEAADIQRQAEEAAQRLPKAGEGDRHV